MLFAKVNKIEDGKYQIWIYDSDYSIETFIVSSIEIKI